MSSAFWFSVAGIFGQCALGQEATGLTPEQLKPLTLFRQQHRRTVISVYKLK
jgi:hypothetical protein